MQTMRERIARRLEPNSWKVRKTAGDSLGHKHRRTSSLRKADAVLEEMREPDEGMEAAGREIDVMVLRSVGSIWTAMIDHARKGEG